jgi:lysophospholipase L1-like esterase
MKNFIVAGLLLVASFVTGADNLRGLSLDSDLIYFKGCNYVTRGPSGITPCRFSDQILKLKGRLLSFNPNTAKWTSGIQMFFSTSAKNINLKMTLLPFRRKAPVIFRVYRDDRVLQDFRFRKLKKENPIEIKLNSADNKLHRYRIDFPTNAALTVTGLEIDKGAKLHEMKLPAKPVYIALGDSVTHGSAGLDGLSAGAYPTQLAELLGYDLYNLGVGGSRVSVAAGSMLKDWKKIDLITLLIGYNDLSWCGVKIKNYRANYIKLIETIRKNHPSVPLFCITLTHTRLKKSPKTGITPDEYRQVVIEIIKSFQQRGDDKIFLVYGENLTDDSCLRDPVHFNPKGNKQFAKGLYNEISKTLKIKGK